MEQKNLSTISSYESAVWLARMAAADGVITPREKMVMEKFASKFGIDAHMMASLAEILASDLTPEVICLGEEYLKGYDFEKFVVGSICTGRQDTPFSVIRWRGDKSCDGIFSDDDKKPDLHIKCLNIPFVRDFYLECKYRSTPGPLANLKRYQLIRYMDIARADRKLAFIMAGFGGTPSAPDEIYFVPLWEWKKDSPDFDKYRFKGGSLVDFVNMTIQEYQYQMSRILHRI